MFHRIDDFWITECLNAFHNKAEIAFWAEKKRYYKANASTRVRCYDIMLELRKQNMEVEFYSRFRDYKLVVIGKAWDTNTLNLVEMLKRRGTRVIYDVFFDAWEDKDRIAEVKNVIHIAKLADAVITVSEIQKQLFEAWNKNVYCIPEGIKIFRDTHKNIRKKGDTCCIAYIGYADKAQGIYKLKNLINELVESGQCEFVCISDKDPLFEGIKYNFIRYNQKKIDSQMAICDIALAPRIISKVHQLPNSVMKVAMPMAMGIPVLASPVPSYIDTPAIICESEDDWRNNLLRLISSPYYREEIGKKGREYVLENLSIDIIAQQYRKLIEKYGYHN